jgi:hypothetical protein
MENSLAILADTSDLGQHPGLSLQSLAPMVGALLVLLGVVLSLWQNSRKLRHEQLERRAKERQAALQEHYGQFAASCLEYFAINQSKAGIRSDREYLTDVAELDDDERKHRLERVEDRWEKARYRAWDIYAAMAGAFARLLLIENDPARLQDTERLYRRIGAVKPSDEALDIADLASTLEAFMRRVGTELEIKYQTEADLARRGEHPPRLTVNRAT